MSVDPRWRGARRVLALRLDQLGDVLMTTPALAALREQLPAAQITLLTSPAGGALAPHLPWLDAVWTAQVPWMPGAADHAADGAVADTALLRRLAAGAFDAAVIFTVCTQSALPAALACRLAGIPLRLAHARENPYALLTDWVPDPDRVHPGGDPQATRHEVRRQLALVGTIGCTTADERLRFTLRAADHAEAQAALAAAGVGAQFALLHPGASAPSRRWPAARFGQVAARLARAGLVPLVAGSAAERALVDEAVAAAAPARVHAFAGTLSLGGLAALIARAQVLVGNNSGPAHIAAALGTPIASLYAMTNPQHTPWRVRHRLLQHDVPCRGCLKSVCPERHHACLEGVDVPAVVAAALELARTRQRHPETAA